MKNRLSVGCETSSYCALKERFGSKLDS